MKRPWAELLAYLLFFLAGVGFGYAAPPKWRWLPLLFPLALGLWALLKYGPDASVLIRLRSRSSSPCSASSSGRCSTLRSSASSDHARYA